MNSRVPAAAPLGIVTIAAIAFSLGILVARATPAGAQPAAGAEPAAGRLIVQNVYYPRAGMEDDVLATRLEASAVRTRLGLETGRVLLRVEGPEGGPHVMWEAEYESQAAREADVAALDGTDFEAVADHMGTLLDGFERTVWEMVSR